MKIRLLSERSITVFIIIASFNILNAQVQTLEQIEARRVTLPNGWSLTPVGKQVPLGDLPLNIAISPDKKLAVVTNNGQSDQTLQLIDIEKEVTLDTIVIAK